MSPIVVDKAMAAPAWAYAEQMLLRANADVVQAYAAARFDEKWHNRAPEEWGVGSGPDDIPEGLRSWPLAYALGGPESILETWRKFYEGHLEQYTNAKIPRDRNGEERDLPEGHVHAVRLGAQQRGICRILLLRTRPPE